MSSAAPTPDQIASVAELLRLRAAEHGDKTAFVFLPEGIGSDGSPAAGEVAWTYAELDRKARSVAAALLMRANPGDRAVLVFPPGLDFLAAFFGCLDAGIVPVPATYPKPRRPSPRLDAIVADCEPTLALTTAGTLQLLALEDQAPSVQQLAWVAVDQAYAREPMPELVARTRDDVAFLQYTSGSTSEPRGVVVTHGNLLHNLELIRGGFGLPATATGPDAPSGAFWLPAYHDMGLIGGILTPLYVGGTSHLLAPAAFLQRPLSWLETIARTGATVSGAPNFAYELCVKKTTPEQRAALDLSRWSLAFCGAEPIDPAVLTEFAEAFAPAGFRADAFYPCYGLAEATLMAAGGSGPARPHVLYADRTKLAANKLVDADDDPTDALPMVSCGKALGDQEMLIVDPATRVPCSAGSVGEIWIRGKSIARGYWNRPEESAHTFGGQLADGAGPFLRTGDLGSVVEGRLYITGRLKDLIIIRGRNLYPQDIERTGREAHPAIEAGAAFPINVEGREELAVVHQVSRENRRDDMAPVLHAIRTAIVAEHEVEPYAIVILRPATLPLTSSGKVQRTRCRELFEEGELDGLASWQRAEASEVAGHADTAETKPGRPRFLDRLESATPAALSAEILSWMLKWLAERTTTDAGGLDPNATFVELGIDSMTAVELNLEVESSLGLRIPPAAAWSYPTPAALSLYLAESLLGVAPAEEAAQRVAAS